MKKLFLLFACSLFVSLSASAQEDCFDGVDNDTDGLIDLNDPDCDCAGFGGDTISSLIPNPSFEDMVCCPTGVAMLTCADTWIQASSATSDYFNTCGITAKPGMTPPAFPLPGGGDGYAGFYEQGSSEWQEYIGACLTSPMIGGTSYVLNLWIAWGDVTNEFDLAIFGTPNCTDLPWVGNVCPTESGGSWELLDETPLVVPYDGSWIEVTLTFTPSVDMYAVCIGSADEPTPSTWDYFYVDELVLLDSASFSTTSDIAQSGNWCDGDLVLTYATDTVTTGTIQWFQEGVALVGETDWDIDVSAYGAGTYQVMYTLGANCDVSEYVLILPPDPVASFNAPDVCFPDDVVFTDESTVAAGGGTIDQWDWDFDDTNTSTLTDPVHPYANAGSYDVTLTVTTTVGCEDDTTITVLVHPDPTADFHFEMNGISSDDGLTGGCISIPVDFLDDSNVDSPGTITNWDWDFDGGAPNSTDQNPTVTFSGAGTYTVTLTITTDGGCTDTYTFPITMTDELDAVIIQSDPSCWGFQDGAITINVDGFTTTEVDFEIYNESGLLVNVGGSNAANNLPSGTYTFNVSEVGGCSAEGTIIITDPEKMEVDLDIQDVLCYGDATGSVTVDTVNWHQGPFEDCSYDWSSGPPGGQGVTMKENLTAGEYHLILTDSMGCSIDTTFYILQPPPLEFAEIGYEPAYCRVHDYQVGNGQVYAAATGGTPDYAYLWTNLQTLETSIPSTWGAINPGDYEMTVTDQNGCVLTQVVTLDSVNPTAILDIASAQLNGQLQGTAEVCIEVQNVSEYFANPLNPIADTSFWLSMDYPIEPWTLYQDSDFYTVFDTCYAVGGDYDVCLKIKNKNGCIDSVCHTITVWDPLEITPPNIFTPNGDGVNDIYTFEYLAKGVRTFNCIIVNRWGVKMAEINDIAQGWDGTDRNGSTCRDGVYFFVYSGEAENGETFEGQGNIQIIGTK